MISILGFKITPTIFPDKTSQVWKLDPELILNIKAMRNNNLAVTIDWDFEGEAELFHIVQLHSLLIQGFNCFKIELNIPYLPYGRQDKQVSNESTFALQTFANVINSMEFDRVLTIDAHSGEAYMINRLVNKPANKVFQPTPETILCYPDKGAADRYIKQYPNNDYIVLEKKRNQLTGEIERIEIQVEEMPDKKQTICIVDDICDGGRTFIEAAKLLQRLEPKEIHLYVSHGIFSKGLKVLTEAGISKIFTHKGEVNLKEHS